MLKFSNTLNLYHCNKIVNLRVNYWEKLSLESSYWARDQQQKKS